MFDVVMTWTTSSGTTRRQTGQWPEAWGLPQAGQLIWTDEGHARVINVSVVLGRPAGSASPGQPGRQAVPPSLALTVDVMGD